MGFDAGIAVPVGVFGMTVDLMQEEAGETVSMRIQVSSLFD